MIPWSKSSYNMIFDGIYLFDDDIGNSFYAVFRGSLMFNDIPTPNHMIFILYQNGAKNQFLNINNNQQQYIFSKVSDINLYNQYKNSFDLALSKYKNYLALL